MPSLPSPDPTSVASATRNGGSPATAPDAGEEELRQSEARKDAVLKSALDAIVTIDQGGNFVEFNPAAERIFGYVRADVIGRPMADLIIPPRLRERHHAGLTHYLATGEGPVLNRQIELPALRADGTEFPAELAIVPVSGAQPPLFTAFLRDITERKQSEEALQGSEARFRAAVAAVSSLIWTNDAEGMMKGDQPGWENFTGQTQAEYQGYGWTKAVHPDDAPPTIAAWERAVAEKRLFVFQHRLRRGDGEWRFCSIRAVPVLESDGGIREWVGVHTDITERQRDEEAVRQAHHQLQNVLGSITDGLAVLDKEWRYTYFSEQGARIVGMNAADLLGACVWDLFPATEGTKFQEAFHRAVDTGQKIEFEEYYPEPINKWLECHCYPSDEGLSVYFHDVTVRKQAEATLRQNEVLFSKLIEQAPMGVYVVDAQFRLQQVNSQAEPVFSNVRPLIGRDFTEVMETCWGREVGGEVARIFRHTLETGERYISPPFVHPRADLGVEQAYDWEAQRVILPDGQHGVVCYFIDVTERRRADAALLEAKNAAETANQSKDRFLAVLSHELRTPLTPVLMVGERAGARPRPSARRARGLGDDQAQHRTGNEAHRRPARPQPNHQREGFAEERSRRSQRSGAARLRHLPAANRRTKCASGNGPG